jgi:hypothetical protein
LVFSNDEAFRFLEEVLVADALRLCGRLSVGCVEGPEVETSESIDEETGLAPLEPDDEESELEPPESVDEELRLKPLEYVNEETEDEIIESVDDDLVRAGVETTANSVALAGCCSPR